VVERLPLTPEFVDTVLPPERGERWVADTAIQGFGLRLWATRRGEGKAFAIRTFTSDGKSVRKSFDARNSWEYRFVALLEKEPVGLGSCLDSARRWAWHEIAHLKGQTTFVEQLENRRRQAAEKTLRRTVQQVGQNLLQRMRSRKLGEAYIDRLDKLFSIYLPEGIREATLADIEPAQMAAALSVAGLPPSAVGVLRPFIGRIFREAIAANPSLYYFSKRIGDHLHEHPNDYLSSTGVSTEDYYNRLFNFLECENKYWQQAMCIRLYFEFRTPLSRLMAARWKDIVDDRWYPYPASEQTLNLRYGGRVVGNVVPLLDRVRSLGEVNLGPNPYWFPSRYGRKFGHIRTVDTVWRNALHISEGPISRCATLRWATDARSVTCDRPRSG
jgi:hypothetical protein